MIIIGMNKSVNGGIPIIDTHLPPYILRMGLLSLSAIRYIPGTITSVIKNAEINPKMIVHASGFQNLAAVTTNEYMRVEVFEH